MHCEYSVASVSAPQWAARPPAPPRAAHAGAPLFCAGAGEEFFACREVRAGRPRARPCGVKRWVDIRARPRADDEVRPGAVTSVTSPHLTAAAAPPTPQASPVGSPHTAICHQIRGVAHSALQGLQPALRLSRHTIASHSTSCSFRGPAPETAGRHAVLCSFQVGRCQRRRRRSLGSATSPVLSQCQVLSPYPAIMIVHNPAREDSSVNGFTPVVV